MRPDGTRVKDLPPIVAAVPYIMPKRYDAWNSITEYIDEEAIKSYIREKRRSGVRINHMAVIIAAYYKAIQTNPKLNYFVVNSHIYRRNHFSVSFVILKKLADGSPDETTLKIYLEPSDTVFTIQQKITDAIEANRHTEQKNSTDKFARMMFSVPGLQKIRGVAGVPSGQARAAAPQDHRPEPVPHQPVHHQSGVYQDQPHLPPLL